MAAHIVTFAVTLCLAGSTLGAWAQQADKTAERAARRAQMQAQALQQQLQDAQVAMAKLEADKTAANKLAVERSLQVERLRTQLTKTTTALKAAETARDEFSAKAQALDKQLIGEQRSSEQALATKARELAQYTQLRDEQLAVSQRQNDAQAALVGECTEKNTRLVKLSSELVDRWRNKSVTDVVKQRDLVLGLGDVQMFNLIQDYRDKADAERFVPSINR